MEMRDVVIAGAHMTVFGKFVERGLKSLVNEAVDGALRDASCPPDEVRMVYFGNSLGGLLQRQECVRGQVWLSESQLSGVTVVNVENACASGATALHQAWLSVAAGLVDVAVAVGAEKMSDKSGNRPALEALQSGVDQDRLDKILRHHGMDGGSRSLFMEIYADHARRYAERTGATREDFARVAVKNHDHGSRNPKAQYHTTYTLGDVLAARIVREPLTVPMCSPISDGAAAVVLTTPQLAHRWQAHPVRVLAAAMGGGRVGSEATAVADTAARAYATAGIQPTDVDVVECHDAMASRELIVMEQLGLCDSGQAPALVRAGATTIGGSLPINPSGGLISKGHPIGATGIGQIVELCDQLRDRAGDRQVERASIALAENAGGYLGPDVAAATVTILQRT
jgi:acetyl-CoA acetyltransferase